MEPSSELEDDLFRAELQDWVRWKICNTYDGLTSMLPEHAEQRADRVREHLEVLRKPLNGLELDDNDHAVLTWLADHDAAVVSAIASLMHRARSA